MARLCGIRSAAGPASLCRRGRSAIRPNISAEGIIIRIEGVAKQHMALLTFEEKLLRQQYPEYASYAAKTGRMIPFLF